MFSGLESFLVGSALSFWTAVQLLAISAVYFGLLALLVKGTGVIQAAKDGRRETAVNLWLFVLDALLIAPLVAIMVSIIRVGLANSFLELVRPETWDTLPVAITAVAAIFVGDFISYWRHRLEHTRLLWPSHAIHHSDTAMTWLTLSRFHPINRVTTMAIDTTFLAVAGFPEWSLVLNIIVRHFYGEFVHADFPWTYGPVGRVMVSPAMHRWHHARDVEGAGSNFATVFSVFDQAFGTYYVPGPCDVPLGVNDEMGSGTAGQLLYPFLEWGGRMTARVRPRWRKARRRLTQTLHNPAGQ